jgi:hypothetical protein
MVKYTQTTPTKTLSYIREYPLVGSLPGFMRGRLNFLVRVTQERVVCGFHIGSIPIILFNKPEHVQSILVEHADDFYRRLPLFQDRLSSLIRCITWPCVLVEK